MVDLLSKDTASQGVVSLQDITDIDLPEIYKRILIEFKVLYDDAVKQIDYFQKKVVNFSTLIKKSIGKIQIKLDAAGALSLDAIEKKLSSFSNSIKSQSVVYQGYQAAIMDITTELAMELEDEAAPVYDMMEGAAKTLADGIKNLPGPLKTAAAYTIFFGNDLMSIMGTVQQLATWLGGSGIGGAVTNLITGFFDAGGALAAAKSALGGVISAVSAAAGTIPGLVGITASLTSAYNLLDPSVDECGILTAILTDNSLTLGDKLALLTELIGFTVVPGYDSLIEALGGTTDHFYNYVNLINAKKGNITEHTGLIGTLSEKGEAVAQAISDSADYTRALLTQTNSLNPPLGTELLKIQQLANAYSIQGDKMERVIRLGDAMKGTQTTVSQAPLIQPSTTGGTGGNPNLIDIAKRFAELSTEAVWTSTGIKDKYKYSSVYTSPTNSKILEYVYNELLGKYFLSKEINWGQSIDPSLLTSQDLYRYFGHYQEGGVVPQTGPAIVHKGETVLPAGVSPISINPTININGTSGNVAQQVKDEILRELRQMVVPRW